MMTSLDKKQYLQTAKNLHYSRETVNDIKNAKTESECLRILTTARKQQQ